jgi:predicted  nucleic acid-binding Zn-ribbon protein
MTWSGSASVASAVLSEYPSSRGNRGRQNAVTTLDLLRQLQMLDSLLDADRERIATIEATVGDRSEYESARRDHQTRATALKQLESQQRDLELQAGNTRQQLVEGEQRLYSGQIRSPRELEDLKQKGDDQRRQINAFDERQMVLMEQIENASAAAREAEARLRAIVADRRTMETELLAERKSLAAEIRSSQTERDNVRAQIDAPTLHIYDRLRDTRGGQALAEVRQRTCQGCRVSMTAAAEQRLRRSDALVMCQSCGRILYPGD